MIVTRANLISPIADLARRAARTPQPAVSRNGIPLLSTKPATPPVTLELVNKRRDS